MLITHQKMKYCKLCAKFGLVEEVTWSDAYRAVEVWHKGGDVWREAIETWR